MPGPDLIGWAVLLSGALFGSVIGGVAGFGTGIIMLPLIAWVLGLRAVAPVLTIAMLLGNLARIWWSRHEVDRRVATRFLIGAVPATAVGAALYVGAPGEWLRWIIGGFLIGAVPLRRLLMSRYYRMRLAHFPFVGGFIGLLSSIVVTTGPVMTPFFLAYGLRRGAFIATEAVCVLGMHLTRTVAFARYSVLTWETVVVGAALGGTMFAGAWVGRRLLDRMSDRLFLNLIEGLLVLLGLQFLLFAR